VVESWGITGRAWNSLAIQAANRALELDPGLSTPWAVIGQVAIDNGDYVSSISNLDRAIQMDSANATAYLWRGINYSSLGFQAESIADFERCLEIDPAYANCKRHLALAYMIVNENDKALSLLQEVAAEAGFTVFDFHSQFIQRHVTLGQRLAATIILSYMVNHDMTFPASAILDAMEYPDRDHSRGLQKLLDWIEKSGSTPASYGALLVPFKAYQLIQPNPSRTQIRWVWMAESKGFRSSAYFASFMNKTGEPIYWREKGFPPGCRPLAGDGFECD